MIDVFKLILLIALVSGLIVFIINIPKFIRRYRLSKIAKELSLSFEAGKFFYFSTPAEIKRNLMKGVVNGHQIELYDSIITYDQWVPLGGPVGGSIPKRCTVSIIDNKKEAVSQWLGWFASVSKIKKILKSIN